MKKQLLPLFILPALLICSCGNEPINSSRDSQGTESQDSSVLSSEEEEGSEGLEYYVLDDGSYAVGVGGAKMLSNIVIPSRHNAKPVTMIMDYGFSYEDGNYDKLKSISIPSTVTSIGKRAFSYCQGLTNVTLPENLAEIGNDAFNFCINLVAVTIPNKVTTIPEWCFYGCSNLTSVSLPNNLLSIKKGAFYSCSNLRNMNIPNSLEEVENYAFESCTSLQTIYKNYPFVGNNTNPYLIALAPKYQSEFTKPLYLHENTKFAIVEGEHKSGKASSSGVTYYDEYMYSEGNQQVINNTGLKIAKYSYAPPGREETGKYWTYDSNSLPRIFSYQEIINTGNYTNKATALKNSSSKGYIYIHILCDSGLYSNYDVWFWQGDGEGTAYSIPTDKIDEVYGITISINPATISSKRYDVTSSDDYEQFGIIIRRNKGNWSGGQTRDCKFKMPKYKVNLSNGSCYHVFAKDDNSAVLELYTLFSK